MFMDWRLKVVKVEILPHLIYRFNVKPNKNPIAFFRIWRVDPKIHMKCRGPRIAQKILKKKRGGRLKFPVAKLHNQESVLLIQEYTRRGGWRNRIENSEVDRIDFQQVCQDHSIRSESCFQQVVLGTSGCPCANKSMRTLTSHHI